MAATLNLRDHFRAHWRELKGGRPGHRFQDHYRRVQRHQADAGPGKRLAMIVAGILCFAIGVVLMIFPGPAIPFFFLAGGLLATESQAVARIMDWSEVHLRNLAAWGKRRWKRLPAAARVVLVAVGMGCSVATAYFSYRLLRG